MEKEYVWVAYNLEDYLIDIMVFKSKEEGKTEVEKVFMELRECGDGETTWTGSNVFVNRTEDENPYEWYVEEEMGNSYTIRLERVEVFGT